MRLQMDSVQVTHSGRRATFRRLAARLVVGTAMAASVTSCTTQQTQGHSPAYLVIEALEGAFRSRRKGARRFVPGSV